MTKSKRIGILTSGGDCAGLNAVVRAAVNRAALLGWTVVGIEGGVRGLMTEPATARELTPDMFDGSIMRRGGTFLATTNTGDPFAFPDQYGEITDRSDDVIRGYHALNLDALIGIGGDGSQAILFKLAQKGGVNLVCIPKTIDNDIGLTEVSIGYDTAVQVATEALDNLQPTAASHNRIMILEVMGRDAGHIALVAGIAGGADVILIPEIPYRLEHVVRKIEALRESGRGFALIIVAESTPNESGNKVVQKYAGGASRYGGISHLLGDRLGEITRSEIRVTVLGHVQRGAAPDARDRLMASVFGVHAVDLIAVGNFNRMVAWRNRDVTDVALQDVIQAPMLVDLDGPIVHTARGLGICLGDV
jgi:ATP-dependent phosphofructokinase / diphosphate-dependent phosphofructokinase